MSLRTPEGGNGLEPCTSTSRLFLFAQATSILCLQHETLALERRFVRHAEKVTIISADNASDEGSAVGRVVSVDAAQMAIVWDTTTGDEISRFSMFAETRVASWMRNGNLVFGDIMGNVILFDPLRSESICARTIYDPLCAIAPSADCRTFALGYNNGSILVAALTPSFTILHTLTTTSLSPSPIATLAWHNSSSRQRSDMLATQTYQGDLRVWSVPKTLETDEPPRVVRILKKSDTNRRGNNWMGWSRNGRIVQYSEGDSTIWDVRTKKVTWERVGTLDNVAGITIYGPKGSLFTIGKDNTVQQFSLYPPTIISNVQHIPTVPPPSPPVSIGEKKEEISTIERRLGKEEEEYMVPTMSPLGRIAHELEQLEKIDHQVGGLGISNVPSSRTPSISSRSSTGSFKGHQHNVSTSSKGTNRSSGEHSDFSVATTISAGRKNSVGAQSTASRRQHPLRQEIQPNPEAGEAVDPIIETDIFSHLRSRLPTVTYQSPRVGSPQNHLNEDDLRREMLWCIFGWKGDIEELIQDELDSVDSRSANAIMLRMWLGDLDQNSLSVMLGTELMVSGDWMLLALSAMGGQKSWNHVVRAFVMRLLQKGELHTAVLCLLALGDRNDAVEIYVSHKKYMEALLLATLLWKKDWKRQSQLVRKWGEHASENSDGVLAVRCFACAGTDAPEAPPERIPERPHERISMLSRTHSRSRSENETMQSFVRSLSISAPSNPRATLRMTPKNSPLKLITTFPSGDESAPVAPSATTSPTDSSAAQSGFSGGVNRFFAWAGDRGPNRTPISATPATPIGTSLTPIDPFWRRDRETAFSALKGPAGGQKLPPVTESSPVEPAPKPLNKASNEKLAPPAPEAKTMKISSPIEARNSSGFSEGMEPVTFGDHTARIEPQSQEPQVTSPAAPFSRVNSPVPPVLRRPSPPTVAPVQVGPPPVQTPTPPPRNAPTGSLPAPPVGISKKDNSNKTGASQRKPAGLHIQWPPMDTILRRDTRLGFKHKRTGSRKVPPISTEGPKPAASFGDDLESVLDILEGVRNKRLDSQRAAPPGTIRRRAESPDARGRNNDRQASRDRNISERRGRQIARESTSGMRSPSSPLPMSPQARLYREDIEAVDVPEDDFEDERYYTSPVVGHRGRTEERNPKASAMRSPSSPLPMSPQAQLYRDEDPQDEEEFDDERYYTSPVLPANSQRGRSNTRKAGASMIRSPSSPLPMSPQAKLYQEMADEIEQDFEEERYPRRSRHPTREDSRTRGPQHFSPGIRRSRSEKALRQWSDQLGRAASMERRPSISMQRNLSIRGLPATPRAWRAELISASRSGSAAGTPRGRSPAMAPAPPRSMTPGRNMSPAPRTMSPANCHMSPAPRTMSPANRHMSPAPRTMSPANRHMSPTPRTMSPANRHMSPAPTATTIGSLGSSSSHSVQMGLPARPTVLRMQNYYYDSTNDLVSPRSFTPEIAPLPSTAMSRSDSHSRNNSTEYIKPIIRKLPPQPPPDSPPPLPKDLPVHPALQMHLDPSTPGLNGRKNAGGRVIRNIQKTNEMMSIDERFSHHEQSILVGIEDGDAMRWEGGAQTQIHYQLHDPPPEMQQRNKYSPSIGSVYSREQGDRGAIMDSNYEGSPVIGTINQF
ncbi:hypothetical protein RUND412_001681 [Rhizina undulata]